MHMYNKFKVGESEVCPCNADIMTADHLLQYCQLHEALRWDMWPEPIPLRDKLYGNLEELRRTTTGISVQRTTPTKKKASLPDAGLSGKFRYSELTNMNQKEYKFTCPYLHFPACSRNCVNMV